MIDKFLQSKLRQYEAQAWALGASEAHIEAVRRSKFPEQSVIELLHYLTRTYGQLRRAARRLGADEGQIDFALTMDANSKKAAIILFLLQLREYSIDSSTEAAKNNANEKVVNNGATTRRSQTQIFVKGVDGKTIAVLIKDDEDPLTKVANVAGLQSDEIWMSYGGKPLNSGCNLTDFGIQQGSTVTMIRRLCGGMPVVSDGSALMMSPAAQCRLHNRQARKAREANAMWEAEQEENAKEMRERWFWAAAVVLIQAEARRWLGRRHWKLQLLSVVHRWTTLRLLSVVHVVLSVVQAVGRGYIVRSRPKLEPEPEPELEPEPEPEPEPSFDVHAPQPAPTLAPSVLVPGPQEVAHLLHLTGGKYGSGSSTAPRDQPTGVNMPAPRPVLTLTSSNNAGTPQLESEPEPQSQPEPTSEREPEPEPETRSDNIASPVNRSVSLRWLLDFVAQNRGKRVSFERREFLAPDDGGGSEAGTDVTAETLSSHRIKRRASEAAGTGQPVTVRYSGIVFEAMTTADVMEAMIRPVARTHHKSFAEAKIRLEATGLPTYFVSHAWDSLFVDLVESVAAFLEGAAKDETYAWLDIFAINQDDTGRTFSAMAELDDGRTLAHVIELSRATLVVLDKERVAPFTRLWCLYEIGSTPTSKLQLLTHGF
eukprot:SAG22_NODE_1692_length_3804_cov_7.159784_4_plen_652_part_01